MASRLGNGKCTCMGITGLPANGGSLKLFYNQCMNNMRMWLLPAVLLWIPIMVSAQEVPVEDDLGFTTEAPSAEELEGAEEIPLELDPITVSGQSLSFRQEVALRIVRQAYNAPRSDRQEDIDKWVCWLGRPTGSHFKHLSCARNGDIWALRPAKVAGSFGVPFGKAGYGKVMQTTRTVNRWKLEQALAALPGSSDFDREFLGMVMAGQQPPRDIPADEELDLFANAWVQVEALNKAGTPENEQITAIEKAGLSLKRYNRIAELVETYQSVENQVDERIKKLD